MEPLSAICKLYVVSTFVGSLFMVISVLMGRLPRAHVGAHHGGHPVTHAGSHAGSHAGPHAGSHAGPHAAGHSGPQLTNNAGHGSHAGGHAAHTGSTANAGQTGHSGAKGQAASPANANSNQTILGNQANSVNSNIAQSMSLKMQARTGGHLHVGLEEHGIVEIIVSLLNPLSVATFLAFFGITGMIFSLALHVNAWITFALAVTAGWLAVQAVVHIIGWLFLNMNVSTESKVADLIGQLGEVTVPITNGRTGQITYIVQSKRLTAPAKSLKPDLEIQKKTPVVICDMQNNVMLVDLWHEDFTDPTVDKNITTGA